MNTPHSQSQSQCQSQSPPLLINNKNTQYNSLSPTSNKQQQQSPIKQQSPSNKQSNRFSSPRKVNHKKYHQQSTQPNINSIRALITNNLIEEAITLINRHLENYHQQLMSASLPPPSLASNKNNKHIQQSNQQPKLNLLFCLATCLFSKKNYSQCLQTLQEIKEIKDDFKYNQTYLLMAICYRSLGDYQKALQVINNSLMQFSNHKNFQSHDYLFLKATILKTQHKYNQAQIAFQQTLNNKLSHNNQHSQKELLQIYYLQQNYQKAETLIKKALQRSNVIQSHKEYLRQKKIELLYKTQRYQQCLQSLNQVQKQYPQKITKFHYIKGKVYLKLLKYQETIISFNQVLQTGSDTHFLKLSLVQLIIHFLKQRDYYQASLYAKRRAHLFTQNITQLQHLSFLAQGLILLMKKNFLQALNNFSFVDLQPVQKYLQKKDKSFISNLLLNGQGYGLLSLGRHKQALIKYESLQISEKDEEYLGCEYNKEMIRGILSMTFQQDEQKSLSHFQRAISFVRRPEPFFYMGVILGQKSLREGGGFEQVLGLLQRGIQISECGQMLYYRGLVKIYQEMNLQGIQDLQRAIQISQQNMSEHFYAKGVIYFLQQNLQQAISEFDVALSIDERDGKSILQKGKCLLLLGNVYEAYASIKLYKQVCGDESNLLELYFMLHEQKYAEILEFIGCQQRDGERVQKIQRVVTLLNDNKDNQLQQQQVFKQSIPLQRSQESSSSINQLSQLRQICNFYLGRFEQGGAGGKLMLGLIYGGLQQVLLLIQQAMQLGVSVGPVSIMQMSFLKGYALFKLSRYRQCMVIFECIQRELSNGYGSSVLSNEEIQIRLLIVKINIILCMFCIGNTIQAVYRLQLLMQDVNQGIILYQLNSFYELMLANYQNQQLQNNCIKDKKDNSINTYQNQDNSDKTIMERQQGNKNITEKDSQNSSQSQQYQQELQKSQSQPQKSLQNSSQYQQNQQHKQKQKQKQQKLQQKQPYQVCLLQNQLLLSHHFPSHTHKHITFKILLPYPVLHIPQLHPNKQKLLQQFTIKSIQNKPEPPWIKRGDYGLIFTNQLKEYTHLHLNTQQNDSKRINDLKLPSSLVLKLSKITTKS